MSAVINEKAFKAINDYIEKGKSEGGRVLSGGGSDSEQGFFIEPTVIADVKAGATIEQEEIFGPVLALIKAEDYDDALKIANGTQYGLTGAVYSADEAKLERARASFTSVIFTSTASAPERSSVFIRSVASTCPERIRRRVGASICCCSCRRSFRLRGWAQRGAPRQRNRQRSERI